MFNIGLGFYVRCSETKVILTFPLLYVESNKCKHI